MRIKKTLILILVMVPILSYSQQTTKSEGSNYAILYIVCANSYKIKIHYEDGKIEDYTEINQSICRFEKNSLVLMQAFKYLEGKGYKLISSASIAYNSVVEQMEYIFRKD
jgi:hypothetical protein